jgi:acyl-CoA thioesterase
VIEPPDENDFLFGLDAGRLVPTDLTQGPWDPEHQHGGAVCAALAWAVEQEPAPVPMRTVRIAFDLMHPAPMQPLRPQVTVVRAGRRVQLLDVALLEGERAVARASALRVRVDTTLGLDAETRGASAPPLAIGPEGIPPMKAPRRFAASENIFIPGFIRAVDLRRQQFEATNGEPNISWSRLRCRVVDGQEPSPFVRLASQVDFVSGVANGLDFTRWVSINPDVTLQVEREPEGEWIGIEAITSIADDGIGHSRGALYDRQGRIGHASSALYVAPR